jgi:preprotein translocase subunit YajC
VAALILIVVVLALIWFLFIMPQRRRQSAQTRMIADLEVGDEVLTVGGMYGQVEDIDDDQVLVEIAPGTSVRMAKRAIATVLRPEPDEEEEDEEVEEDEEEPDEEEDGAESTDEAKPLENSDSEDVKRR